MYVQSPTADPKRIVHAVLTDQLAHFAPSLHVRLTGQTGMQTLLADRRDMEEVRPHLARPFRDIADEDLAWLGFWLVCCKADDQG